MYVFASKCETCGKQWYLEVRAPEHLEELRKLQNEMTKHVLIEKHIVQHISKKVIRIKKL